MANIIFSPRIFSNEVLRKFDQKNVFMRYANTDYTGDLKKAGDSVTVQVCPSLTFTASSITSPWASTFQTWTWPGWVITATDFVLTTETIVITKYVEKRFLLSDFETTQSNLSLETKVADRVAVAMNNMMEYEFLKEILVTSIATIPTENKLYSWTPKWDISKTTIYWYIEEMRVALANKNVKDNLVLALCPKHFSALLQSWLLDNSNTWLDKRISGEFKMLWGVKVIESTSLSADLAWQSIGWFEMIMFQEQTVNFITQITDSKITEGNDWFYKNLLFTMVWWSKIFTESAKGICVFYATA